MFPPTAGKSHGAATTTFPASLPTQSSKSSQPGVRTLHEIEAEMRAKQQTQNHVFPLSVVPHTVTPSSLTLSSPPTRQSPQSNLPTHSSPSRLTPEEVEHQLRMMHLTQLQQHQAQRQEQQQEPIYQSVPQQRQHYLHTPEQDRQHILQQHQVHQSFPPTPEPQFPVHSHLPLITQGYITQQQLHMQQQLLVQLSQAGVMPDQIHLLDPVQREAIMNEAMRKIMAAERLDQRNRRRLMKMERMVRENQTLYATL